jgi:hypothetical protein
MHKFHVISLSILEALTICFLIAADKNMIRQEKIRAAPVHPEPPIIAQMFGGSSQQALMKKGEKKTSRLFPEPPR